MANIKTITKKLVEAGYSESKLILMTEKDVRAAYKDYKKSLKEENSILSTPNTTTETIDNAMENKEETTMEALVKRLESNQKVQDAGYIKKDDLRVILNEQFGFRFNNKATRTEMVETFMAMYKDSLNIADEVAYGNIQTDTMDTDTVSVGDFCCDKAPEVIEYEPDFVPVEFNDNLATEILEKVIRQADTNKAHNFISDWMLTSIISELIIGLPLKDKKGTEYYKTFTDEQKKNLVEIRKAFIKRANLIAKHNNSKVSGYYIPAKVLVWGRHKYLGLACVYRFMVGNRIAAEYHVSLNGIKNVATGVITPLDDNAYATLDSKCIFVM